MLDSVEHQNVALDGKLGQIPELVAFAMEVNFKDFLAGFARIVESSDPAAVASPEG